MDTPLTNALEFLLYSEIIAALFATIFYKKFVKTPLKYLLIILWLIVFTEQFGSMMGEKKIWLYMGKYNYWLYNIMFPIWKLLYLFIFYKTLENLKFKSWVKKFMIIMCIAVVINWVFLEKFLTDLESYSRIIGALFIVIAAVFYLIELLRSDKIVIFHKKLIFWISIGLLIFYSGTIPFIIVQNYYSDFDYVHNTYLIIYILGTIMYLTFTFGFIWSKKESH